MPWAREQMVASQPKLVLQLANPSDDVSFLAGLNSLLARYCYQDGTSLDGDGRVPSTRSDRMRTMCER